jgi:capsular polysaccharide biosynthesis protein
VTDQENVENGSHQLTPAEKARVVEQLRDGVPPNELAREFGVPYRVVRKWARHERRLVAARANGGGFHDYGARELGDDELDEGLEASARARAPVVGWLREEVQPEPYVSVGRSARAHWRLVLAFAAFGVALALVAGLARPPSYSAQTRLVVGKTVQLSNLAATPGLALASQQLASDYSRLVSTHSVLDETARALNRTPGSLGGRVSASPIPESPVILLEAHAANAHDAVAIANAGAGALVKAVNTLNTEQLQSSHQLLDRYRKADDALLRDQQTLKSLQNQLNQQGANAPRSLEDQIVAAQTAVDADRLDVNSLASDYEGTLSPGRLNEQVVQRVGKADATGNDRMAFLEIALLVGLVAGVLVGIALAALIDARAAHRREEGVHDAGAHA